MTPPTATIEIARDFLQVFHAGKSLCIALERLDDGRLSPACREAVQLKLGSFFSHASGVRASVLCALPANGAMLRVVGIPPCSDADLVRVLTLQVENELPVPPSELAWGYRVIPQRAESPNIREALIAAVKRETVLHYQELLQSCGLEPVFTLGALVRATLVPKSEAQFAMLDIGVNQSELTLLNGGDARAVRMILWGEDVVTKIVSSDVPMDTLATGANASPSLEMLRSAAELLAARLPGKGLGQRLIFTGRAEWLGALAAQTMEVMDGRTVCEAYPVGSLWKMSPSIEALNRVADGTIQFPLLVLATEVQQPIKIRRLVSWHWLARAAALLLVLLFLRWLEPVIQEKRLSSKLNALKTYRDSLPNVERELGFLQNIKTNQAPYLDTIAVLSRSAPQGVVMESFSMQRRGEISIRAGMRDATQLAEFRSKLVASGFFSTVVVEEQTPSPDNQKLTVRMTAQLRPQSQRKPLTDEASKEPPKPARAEHAAPVLPKSTNTAPTKTNSTT